MNRKFLTSVIFPFAVWGVSLVSTAASHGTRFGLGAAIVYAQTRPFYEGKTVRIVIGPGGGYDYWGRLLARYMPKYIPGNPSFIAQNMPGAGSVIATNYVYNVAKPDGLTVGMPTQQIYMGEFVGNQEIRFQMRRFLWIGSPDRNPAILYIRADTPYKSIDDVIKSKIPPKCGGTGWEVRVWWSPCKTLWARSLNWY